MKITKNEIWIKGKDRNFREDIENTLQNLPRKYSGMYQVIYFASETQEICKFSITKGLNMDSVPLLKEKYGEENVIARQHEYTLPDRPPIKHTKQPAKKSKPKDTTIRLLKKAMELLEEINGKLDRMDCQSINSVDSEVPENSQEPAVKAEE